MQLDDAAIILASADFFDICTDEERRMLAFASERKRHAAGTVILKSGEIPLGAQVLISGTISIVADGTHEPDPIVVSRAGTVVSAMALVVGRPREVTVTAISIVETLMVPRHAFLKLANQSPQLAARAANRVKRELGAFVSALAPMRPKMKKE